VQVFYGTDRQAAEPLANDWRTETVRFLPTIGSGLLSLCLALVALHRRKLGFWMLVFGGVGVTLGLGLQATNSTITAIRQEGKSGLWYTTERSPGNRIELGQCEVTIPRSHVAGELEAPSMLRLEVRENAAQHVVLRKTERLAEAAFYDLLKQRVNASPRKELFVFVHGFNVSFEDAARRTAQIHFDLHFEGAPVFFSWPAHDKFVLTYPADESSVATSAPHLKQFLLEIVKHTEARSINLIAHSMGNRALGIALREIDLELRKEAKLFNQVILAAPDIDAEDFRANIAPAMQRTAQRLTLYASSRDDALLASQLLHRGPRAGDAGSGLVVIPGIDTIDVTAIDSSPWGHSYYGSSDPVLHDLKALFLQATPAEDRTWLSPAERNGLTYWIFQPTRLAGEQPSPR
jgi:esterase/lipase superfamily enzyme